MAYEDNLTEVLRSYERDLPAREHTLTLTNNMEYARPLHDLHGYYIFNDSHLRKVVVEWLRKTAAAVGLSDRNTRRALDAAGTEEVNFLRSLTSTMRPPVKAGEGMRRAHPGNWADITGNLKAAYTHEVS